MILDHQIDALVEAVARKLAIRLVRPIRLIVHQEITNMTDKVVADLTEATDAALAEIGVLVAQIRADVLKLAALPVDNTADIQTQIARLKDGTAAAAAAVTALQSPPVVDATSPAPVDAPVAAATDAPPPPAPDAAPAAPSA